MTARRATWRPVGILPRRRSDSLSKTMVVSLVLHSLFFALVILGQALSKLNKPNYQSFQVDLIASGFGPASPGRMTSKKTRSASKKVAALPGKTIAKAKPRSQKKAAKKATKASPVKTRSTSPKAAPAKVSPPPIVQKVPEKSPVAIQDDPDRLEEWWKKQSKSMKTPSSKTTQKQKKVVTPRRRTAKIDIERKSIVIPLPTSTSKALPKEDLPTKTEPPSVSVSESHGPISEPETHLPTDVDPDVADVGEAGSEQDAPTETASLGATDQNGRIGSSGGASTGSTNFAFPGYLQRIDSKIRWQWAPPPITPEEDSLVVRFDIKKNGNIDKMSVVVEESSGNPFFDQAALRAVYAAHPFPPLPDAYSDQILTVYMHFVVKEAS